MVASKSMANDKVIGRSRVKYVPITATAMPYDKVFSNSSLSSLVWALAQPWVEAHRL